MIKLKLNDIVVFEDRIFRVEKRKFHNRDKNANNLRAVLILLKSEELTKMTLNLLKGGLRENDNH